ncbi:MAG: amino acid-binding protein, partial [Gammaproteobacteria bacterium]|nr:amino acid-binding protein [Gammaproteobacteria bacterium]
MTDQWHMLTLIGEDKPGIVAAVTQALYGLGLNLGETSMLRLGGNFTIMMMVSGSQPDGFLEDRLKPVIEAQGMCLH